MHLPKLGYIHHRATLQNSGIIPGDEFGPLTFSELPASSKDVLALRSWLEELI